MNDEPQKNTPEQNNALSARVLARIDKEHVVVKPRWEFRFKNYLFWLLGGVAVILGSFAFAATIFHLENAGWQYFPALHHTFFQFFLQTAPFLWIIALILFVLVGYVNIKHTKRGYRYPLEVIVIGSIFVSLTLGTTFYALGFGSSVERILGDHPPFFRNIVIEQHELWQAPQDGLLGGRVTAVGPNATSFTLTDFSGGNWVIDSSDVSSNDVSVIVSGGTVHVIGVPIPGMIMATDSATSTFHACFVFPWNVHGVMRPPPHHPFMVFVGSSSPNETKATTTRSEECKGLHPYQMLRELDITN